MTEDKNKISTFAVLRQPGFCWFLLGTTLSFYGQWIQQVTLNWLVFDITSSGTMLGTLNLVRAVATVGLVPMTGVVIDRMSRRTLMFATNSWLLTISLMLGIALLCGYTQVWPLFVFSFLGGAGQAFNMPLRHTVIFDLVPRSLAPNAVALVQTGWALMRSLGPSVGGFLILLVGPGGNFLVMAGAYALITLTIIPLHFPKNQSAVSKNSAFGNLREGIGYVMTNANTRAFLMISWVLPLLIVPTFTVLPPIYAKEIFNGGPQVLGMLISAVGIGGIAGGLVTATLWFVDRRGLLLLLSLLLLNLSLIGFALCTHLWSALLLLALAGFFEMIFLTTNQTLLQMSIPDELRGRVSGVASLNMGLVPLGGLAAGVGSDLIGTQATTMLLAGIAGMIAIIVFLASPTFRGFRLSQTLESGGAEQADGKIVPVSRS